MAAIGRILQFIGWLWVIAGFIGPAFGFPSLSFFPGIVIVFIARLIRSQAQRREMPDLAGGQDEPEPAPEPPERMMNTERRRQERPEAPEPAVIETGPEPEDRAPPGKRNQLLEQIVSAGREAVEDVAVPDLEEGTEAVDVPVARKPMSSAEMIARAHERWDSKPR